MGGSKTGPGYDSRLFGDMSMADKEFLNWLRCEVTVNHHQYQTVRNALANVQQSIRSPAIANHAHLKRLRNIESALQGYSEDQTLLQILCDEEEQSRQRGIREAS